MITGVVTADREAVILVTLEPGDSRRQPVDAVIDTGFTGHLTLPLALVRTLGLPLDGHAHVVLGDGSTIFTDVYLGTILWNGQPRTVEIDAAETDPLVGMALLYGSELRVQVIDGGTVSILPLP